MSTQFLLYRPRLYTLDIFYYIPKTSIIQEFVWQCEDIPPRYPRIDKFLCYWHHNIEAVIQEINIAETATGMRIAEGIFKL